MLWILGNPWNSIPQAGRRLQAKAVNARNIHAWLSEFLSLENRNLPSSSRGHVRGVYARWSARLDNKSMLIDLTSVWFRAEQARSKKYAMEWSAVSRNDRAPYKVTNTCMQDGTLSDLWDLLIKHTISCSITRGSTGLTLIPLLISLLRVSSFLRLT